MPFNENIPQLTPSTSNHADNFNAINNKLLENTQANKDGLSYANSRITGLDNTKLDKTTHTAYKSEQATKDSGQDAKISSLESGKVDKTAYATDKEAQERKDIQQDTALTTETAERTTADEVLQTNLDNKIVLNGDTQSNFNFIGNGLIGDILAHRKNVQIDGTKLEQLIIPTNNDIPEYMFVYDFQSEYSPAVGNLWTYGTNNLVIYANGNMKAVDSKGNLIDIHTTNGFIKNGRNVVIVSLKNGYCTVSVNGSVETTQTGNLRINTINFFGVSSTTTGKGIVYSATFYNKVLTPQEIAHNFSVLNNSQSVNKLQVTDSSNQTSILSLGSTGNHVEMATGRTLEEEYMGVLEGMSQEYSSNGEAITVNDGLKARLVGAEITGQTLKCLLHDKKDNYGNNGFTRTCDGSSNINVSYYCNESTIGTKYTIAFNVVTNTLNTHFMPNGDCGFVDTYKTIPVGFTGKYVWTFTATKASNRVNFYSGNNATGTLTIDNITMVEGEIAPSSCIPFGLSSTVAAISNNGIKYPFYSNIVEGETVVQKRAKGSSNEWVTIPSDEVRDTVANEYRLYSPSGLGSVPSVTDTVDLASGVKTDNTKEIVLDGSESFVLDVQNTTHISFWANVPDALKLTDGYKTGLVISDKLVPSTFVDMYQMKKEGVSLSTSGNRVQVCIQKNKLITQDINGFKAWLAQNPITARYQLATPTTTQLTDAQLQAYAPYKKQILLGGVGGVNDKLTLNSDGSLSVDKKFTLVCPSRLDAITRLDISNTNTNGISIFRIANNLWDVLEDNKQTMAISDKYYVGVYSDFNWGNVDIEGIPLKVTNIKCIHVAIKKNKLESDTVEGFANYLDLNPFCIMLGTQTTTTIPKEVNAPVLTHESNVLSAGEAVSATGFKVKAPIDVMAKINRLEALHI